MEKAFDTCGGEDPQQDDSARATITSIPTATGRNESQADPSTIVNRKTLCVSFSVHHLARASFLVNANHRKTVPRLSPTAPLSQNNDQLALLYSNDSSFSNNTDTTGNNKSDQNNSRDRHQILHTFVNSHNDDNNDHDQFVIHRSLLRRRHVRKEEKAREQLARAPSAMTEQMQSQQLACSRQQQQQRHQQPLQANHHRDALANRMVTAMDSASPIHTAPASMRLRPISLPTPPVRPLFSPTVSPIRPSKRPRRDQC